jgi:3-dehydroquinate synthase
MIINIKEKTTFNLQPIQQAVPVTFNYSVQFTKGLFELDNPLLAQTIAADEETTPKQVLVVVDAGLLQYQEQLLEKLLAYAERYQDVLKLAFEPV